MVDIVFFFFLFQISRAGTDGEKERKRENHGRISGRHSLFFFFLLIGGGLERERERESSSILPAE